MQSALLPVKYTHSLVLDVGLGLNLCNLHAGISLEQAQVLAELFSSKAGLLASPAPCNMAELQAYYTR